jgi:hypothetical protein
MVWRSPVFDFRNPRYTTFQTHVGVLSAGCDRQDGTAAWTQSRITEFYDH